MIILHYLSWVLFFLSSVLLIVVVLLQESKGGGLAEAFGGVGAETFGVKSGGINRFTFLLAGIFCVSAIVISATWYA
jgi:preprotein translocase subunit SecG